MTAPTARATTFDDGIRHIAEEPIVWVRVAAVRLPDDTWQARLVELTSGAVPPSWKPQVWQYPEVLLAGGTRVGQVVAEWL